MTVLTFAFAQQTRARGRVYSSEEGIWLDTIEKRPDNARARINYGVILMRTGRYAHAEQQMRVARDLPADRKTHAQVQLQLGAALCAQRRCEEGIVFIDEALRIDPGLDDADAVLGQAYADVGNIEKAIHYLQRAVDKRPDNPAVLTKLAWLLITTNTQFRDGAKGLELAERAVSVSRRNNAAALEVLGVALAERGRFGEAMTALQEAALLAEHDGDVQGAAALRRQVEMFRTR
jgi:tetratricopeptide (TPR) repeat protein